MCKLTKIGVLVLTLCIALTGAAHETTEAVDSDVCVKNAVQDWSLPQTIEEALSLRDALDELIARCGGEAALADDTVALEDELLDADCDFPRTMYVSSRVPRINVRHEPSTDSRIVGTLAHGAAVEVLGRVEGESFMESVLWYRTQSGENDAYIHSMLLGKSKPAPLPTPMPLQSGEPQQQQQQQQPPEAARPVDRIENDDGGVTDVFEDGSTITFRPLTNEEWEEHDDDE